MVSEILSKFSLFRKKIEGRMELILGAGKYLLFALDLYFLFWTINPRWAIPIRTGEFFKSVSLTFEHADGLWLTRTLMVLARPWLCLFPTSGAAISAPRAGVWRSSGSSPYSNTSGRRNAMTVMTAGRHAIWRPGPRSTAPTAATAPVPALPTPLSSGREKVGTNHVSQYQKVLDFLPHFM
jgi:hypothetical protein